MGKTLGEKYKLYEGASWMAPDGTVYPVPGFHVEWIKEHRELVDNCSTVAEVIQELEWISIVVFSKGYVEFHIKDYRINNISENLKTFLKLNIDLWDSVLIMTLSETHFIQIKRENFLKNEDFVTLLEESL